MRVELGLHRICELSKLLTKIVSCRVNFDSPALLFRELHPVRVGNVEENVHKLGEKVVPIFRGAAKKVDDILGLREDCPFRTFACPKDSGGEYVIYCHFFRTKNST